MRGIITGFWDLIDVGCECDTEVEVAERDRCTLIEHAIEQSEEVKGLQRVGRATNSAGVLSFNVQGAHPSDIGMLLDQEGVAVRTGHHCAQPLMGRYGIPGTVRASFSIYNTLEEVDSLFRALEKVRTFL